MNVERREERFDPQGCYRTTPNMRTFDLMYHMLEKGELDKKSHKVSKSKGKHHRKGSKSPERKEKASKSDKKSKGKYSDHESDEGIDERNGCHVNSDVEPKKREKKSKKETVKPKLVENSRRVVPFQEAERLKETANKVLGEQDLDKLCVIHRYRPHSVDIAPITENGKVSNYVMHVGSALHSKNYVEYYMKEGLQSGNKEHAKRLQRLGGKDGGDRDTYEEHGDQHPSGGNSCSRQEWTRKSSRMREIFSPDSSICSSSSQASPRNLTPISKGRPVYNTIRSSTPQSSRASAGKVSKSSSQLYDARKYSETFGYKIVLGDIDNKEPYDGEAGSVRNKSESRADVASSEDYCKFLTGKTDSSSDIVRNGDGLPTEEDSLVKSDPVRLSEVEMKYKKYQSSEASSTELSLEDSRAHANGHRDSWLESQNTARSSTSKKSVLSVRSDRSHSSRCSLAHSGNEVEHLHFPSRQSGNYDSTRSEDGSITERTVSSQTMTPRRSRSSAKNVEPILTVISSEEVPRLGITSSLNDTNGRNSSFSSSRIEDYMTAEEKAKAHPDHRASEDRINSIENRAVEKDMEIGDQRAEASVRPYLADEGYINTEDVSRSVPPVSHTECADGDKASGEQQNKSGGEGNQGEGDGETKEEDKGTSEKTVEGDGSAQKPSSSRTVKARRDSVQSAPAQAMTHDRRHSSTSNKTPVVIPKRANEMEGMESERGEDQLRDTQFDRGVIPDTNSVPAKKKVERGDDTPRVSMEERTRLTKSAKQRGRSEYLTMDDDERGLEKEYFQPLATEKEEYYTSDVSAKESEIGSPPSTRPSSACSQSSSSTVKSDGKKRKKKSLRRFSKASAGVAEAVEPEIKEESRPASAASKDPDGRGDDSNSIKDAGASNGKNKSSEKMKSPSGEMDEAGDKNTDVRPNSRSSQASYSKAKTESNYTRPQSASSRGSFTAKEKLGTGQGYAIDGEVLNRGIDDNTPRTLRELERDKEDQLAMENRQNVGEAFHKVEGLDEAMRPDSRSSKCSMKSSESAKKAESTKLKSKSPDQEPQLRPSSGTSLRSVKSTGSKSSQKSDKKENLVDKSHNSAVGQPAGQNVIIETSPEGSQNVEKKETEKVSAASDSGGGFVETGVESVENATGNGEFDQDTEKKIDAVLPKTQSYEKETAEATAPSGNQSELNQDVPVEEKAFVENESNETEILKGAVSGSNSLEKILSGVNEGPIDFRPLSASTAKSVGLEREIFIDCKRSAVPQPSKISEVTEIEDNITTARETHRSAISPKSVKDKIIIPHPAEVVKVEKKEAVGPVLNLADVKLESQQDLPADALVHPSMKRKESKADSEKNSEKGLVVAAGAEQEETEHSSQKEDRVKLPSEDIEFGGPEHSSNQYTKEVERPPSVASKKSASKEIERPPSVASQKSASKEVERPPSVASQKSASKEIERPPSVSSQKSAGKEVERPPSVASQKSASKEVERPPSVASQKSAGKEVERPPSVASQKSASKEVERPPSVASQKSAGKENGTPQAVVSPKSGGENSFPTRNEKFENGEMEPGHPYQSFEDKEAGIPASSKNVLEAAVVAIPGNDVRIATNEVKGYAEASQDIPVGEYKLGGERHGSSQLEKPIGVASTFDTQTFSSVEVPCEHFGAEQIGTAQERSPSAGSQKSIPKEGKIERLASAGSHRTVPNEEPIRSPSTESQKLANIDTERPPLVASDKSIPKEGTVGRPPSAGSQKSLPKEVTVERPPSAGSQKVTVERPPSAGSQNSAAKEVKVERPPSAGSQKSIPKERPPSVGSQRSAAKEVTVERTPSAGSLKSLPKEVIVERPPSAGSQRSAAKEVTVERPPSAGSQRSAAKEVTVERPPSAGSQKSLPKEVTVERPPSAGSQKSIPKERPPSAGSQKSLSKEVTVERPPSAGSQRSAAKEVTVERPPSAGSQKSLPKEVTVERPPSAGSQRSAAKEVTVERPPSAGSQKSLPKEVTVERPPSAGSQKSLPKEITVEIPPSAGNQKSIPKERPPSVGSQKSLSKEVMVERPPSAGSQRSAAKELTVERPPSAGSQKSLPKEVTVERPPSAGSQKSLPKEVTVERPPSAGSQKSLLKEVTVERPPSAGSQKVTGERPPSAGSQKSLPKEVTVERPPSAGSQKSIPNERPPSAGSQKSIPKERPPSVGSQKSIPNERPPSAGSQKSIPNERPPSAGSQKSIPNERPPSSGSQKVTVERPPSAGSQKSLPKEVTVERPPSAGCQKSLPKEVTVERPPSAGSQKSLSKEVTVERPPSAGSPKSIPKERPPSAGSQKSIPNERPPSAGSQKSIPNERPPSAGSQKVTVERPPSAGSQKSLPKEVIVERPSSAGSQKSIPKERPLSAGSKRSAAKE
ncbi:uncharacterized protein LOC101857170 isoform X2 [Aplysia californica]|nr:uncharacterized protein LOC101857170 isoform X2 [Aplysia californica]